MALPLIEAPKYYTELPSTGEKIQFRPFIVREQKQLLMAAQADADAQIQATEDIINACTWGKVDAKKLPSYDVEFLFLQIRARSIGENIELSLGCSHCENKQPYTLDVTKVLVDKSAKHNNTIDIGNNVIIKLRDPGLRTVDELRRDPNADAVIKLIASSIDSIWQGDTMYSAADYSLPELIEFIENLSPANLEKVEAYFESLPFLKHTIDFKCTKCEADNQAVLEGLQSFFG